MIYKASLISLVVLFLSSDLLFGNNGNHHNGARSAAMGNASVTLSDVWSMHHNQAGLAHLDNPVAGVFYENRFLLPELSIGGASFAMPTNSGTFGVGFTTFGHRLHRQGKFGVSYGRKLGEVISTGIRINYENTRLGNDYGDNNTMTIEGGILAKVSDELTFGFHLYNPTRAKLAEYNDERLPTVMRVGMSYKFSDQLFVVVEAEKDVDMDAIAKFGLEYHPVDKFYLRAGIASNPMFSTFGFGLKLDHLTIDFASGVHSVLGYTPHISLIYNFNKKQ